MFPVFDRPPIDDRRALRKLQDIGWVVRLIGACTQKPDETKPKPEPRRRTRSQTMIPLSIVGHGWNLMADTHRFIPKFSH